MEKANRSVEMADPVAKNCKLHLDARATQILEVWDSMITQEQMLKVERLMMDEDVQNAMAELTKVFFIAGYTSALDDVKFGRMEV